MRIQNLNQVNAARFSQLIIALSLLCFYPPLSIAQTSLQTIENSVNETGTSMAEDIAVGDDVINDDVILRRLQDVYQSKESLKNITVEVDAGIVTLSGTTNTSQAHESALELASRITGVVDITDEITETYDLPNRIKTLNERFSDMLKEFIDKLPVFIFALIVFLLFWALATFIFRYASLYKSVIKNPFLRVLVRHLSRLLVICLGFVVALEIIEATAVLGTLLGALGILGLAVSFAIRDTVENYIASILLSLRQPFNPNDHVLINEFEGNVVTLTTRETVLMTADGNHVRIPNAMVYKGIIVNYTRNPFRRFSFNVGVTTDVELTAVQALAIETLTNTPGVIDQPETRCQVDEIADSSIILTISGWTDQRFYDFQKVKSEAIRSIKVAFDKADFEMPEPIYRLKVHPSAIGEISDKSNEKTLGSSHATSAQAVTITAADVKKDTYLDKQIEQENRLDPEDNLLEK